MRGKKQPGDWRPPGEAWGPGARSSPPRSQPLGQPGPASPPPGSPPSAEPPNRWRRAWRRSLLLRVLVIVGIAALLLTIPAWLGSPVAFWAPFLRVIFYILLAIWLLRGFYRLVVRAMWPLRNRLLVAYALVAVIPIALIIALAGIAAYLFYGEYAAYLFNQDLGARIERVSDTNNAIAAAVAYRARSGVSGGPRAILAHYDQLSFPQGGITSYLYRANGQPLLPGSPALPAWLQDHYSGLVRIHGQFALAAYVEEPRARGAERVLSLYPLNTAVLNGLARRIGTVEIYTSAAHDQGGRAGGNRAVTFGAASPPANLASSVPLPAATGPFDVKILFATLVPVRAWSDGVSTTHLASGFTRPAVANRRLFSTLAPQASEFSRIPILVLEAVGAFFLIIELIALFFGVRLTRSITRAVRDLYRGTQRVHAGDFSHSIAIRSRDQLAALAESFNEMTGSISGLLQQQRQKERLENEIAIAQEVQAQLFPSGSPVVAGLDVWGQCLPARSVSGDYFDFFDGGGGQVGLALGDVSGKGISAALLMATVASAMRAYQGLTVAAGQTVPVAMAMGAIAGPAAADGGGEVPVGPGLSPAAVLARLNTQLCRSTTPEKYVTLFYAQYDGMRGLLRYANAGHLPPIVFTRQGRERLEQGGMVVGLFETAQFTEAALELHPGDLIVAWSDGITEPENEYGVEFGEERLAQLIEAHRDRRLEEIGQVVLAAVREWSVESEQPDDITLLLARVRA